MLTELLLIAGAGFLGKKAIENPDKAKAVVGMFMDNAMKETNKRYKNGSIDESDYNNIKGDYNKIQGSAGEWQIKDKMNDFVKQTGFEEGSDEYNAMLNRLYAERNTYEEHLAREQQYIEDKKQY